MAVTLSNIRQTRQELLHRVAPLSNQARQSIQSHQGGAQPMSAIETEMLLERTLQAFGALLVAFNNFLYRVEQDLQSGGRP